MKKLLVAKHVHTFVYYFPRHSRVASLSGSNSPVALSRSNSPIAKAPSPSHAGSKRSASEFLLQEEPVKAKEEKVHIPNDHDDNLASKFKQGLERLPQFLKDAHVYADRLDEAELRRTRRWVLAFGGSFDTVPNNHVTHIITSQYHRDAIIQSLVSKRKVLVTRVDWLDESAKKMKLLIPSALE